MELEKVQRRACSPLGAEYRGEVITGIIFNIMHEVIIPEVIKQIIGKYQIFQTIIEYRLIYVNITVSKLSGLHYITLIE